MEYVKGVGGESGGLGRGWVAGCASLIWNARPTQIHEMPICVVWPPPAVRAIPKLCPVQVIPSIQKL